MPFDFSPGGEDVDSMDGFDTEDGEQEIVSEPSGYIPVPGTPDGYVPDTGVDSPPQIQETQEEDYERVLSQVDRRMRVAHYYRSILDSSIFGEDTSEAKIVQGRIRKFCNEELEVIFGMRTATANVPVAQQFTGEEAEILKNLAAQVKMAKEAKERPPSKPTVNKVLPRTPPVVNPIQAQNKPSAPSPRIQVPVQQQKVTAQPPSQQGIGRAPDLRIPEKYRNDPTAVVRNGKVFVQARNDDAEPLWVQGIKNGKKIRNPIMRDVTPPAVPTGSSMQPIPMPSQGVGMAGLTSPYSQIMQQQSDNTLATLDRAASRPGAGGSFARQLGFGLVQSLTQGDE